MLAKETVTIGDKAAAQPAILSTPYREAEDAIVAGVQAAPSALGLAACAGSALTTAATAFTTAAPTFLSQQVTHS